MQSHLHPLPSSCLAAQQVFATLYKIIVGPLERVGHDQFLFTMIDCSTRMFEVDVLQSISAKEVA